ncbi:MAG: hypothetical protein WDN44_14020 [Sphingomonas sp.]
MSRPLLRPGHLGRLAALTALLAVWPGPAQAETPDAVDADAVIARACAGRAGATITEALLGEALLTEAGKQPFEWSGTSPAETRSRELDNIVTKLRALETSGASEPSDDPDLLRASVTLLEIRLLDPKEDDLFEIAPRPTARPFLFREEQPAWQVTCKIKPADKDKAPAPYAWALRAKPEELALTGTDRKTAGAATITVDRTRTILDDGSIKKVTNFKIDATLGYRITPDGITDTVYLYDHYALSRSRTRPMPKLDPGAQESDGDTDALESGFITHAELTPNDKVLHFLGRPVKFFLDAKAATVFDFAKNAGRLKGEMLLRPTWDEDIFFCGLGSYGEGLGFGLKTRCRLQIDLEAARIFRRGSIEQGDFDNFIALGVRPSFEAFLPTGGETALLASVNYRFLPVIDGKPKHLERLDIAMKFRFWTKSTAGIDLGFTYSKGQNEVSYENEDVLSIGLGLIF